MKERREIQEIGFNYGLFSGQSGHALQLYGTHTLRDDAYIKLTQCHLMDICIISLTMDSHGARDTLDTFFNYGHQHHHHHNYHHIMTYKAAYG